MSTNLHLWRAITKRGKGTSNFDNGDVGFLIDNISTALRGTGADIDLCSHNLNLISQIY